jgi:predicted DNA-binding transcriptional regulator AlpA
MTTMENDYQLWSRKVMQQRFSRSRSTVHRWTCEPDFPQPVPRDQNLWRASDVINWIERK